MCVIVVNKGKYSEIWKKNLHWDIGVESKDQHLTYTKFKSDRIKPPPGTYWMTAWRKVQDIFCSTLNYCPVFRKKNKNLSVGVWWTRTWSIRNTKHRNQTHPFSFSYLTFVGPVKRGRGRTSQQVTLWHRFIPEQPLTPSTHEIVQPTWENTPELPGKRKETSWAAHLSDPWGCSVGVAALC